MSSVVGAVIGITLVVFKGRDTDLRREIAVKVLLEQHQGVADLMQRFVEEAQIAGQLQHPGITPVYEVGEFPDRRPYPARGSH